MPYKIIWDEKAYEQLFKFEPFVVRRIEKKILELTENPYSKDIKRLKRSGLFRLRIGDYKVLLEIEEDTIIIFKIGHRKKIYKY